MNKLFQYVTRGLDSGIRDWSQYRRSHRDLRAWFRREAITFQELHRPTSWVLSQLIAALSTEIEGLVYAVRELHGLRKLELSDPFWTIDEQVEIPERTASSDDLEYANRYSHMSRIDVYHVVQGKPVLIEGAPTICEPDIDALRVHLAKPQTIRLESTRGIVEYEFSVATEQTFITCPLLHVDIRSRDVDAHNGEYP